MALTKDFRETIRERAQRQPQFRKALLREAIELMLSGDEKTGRRPVYGGCAKFQEDPYWKDYVLFYEYFHGDNGAGLGASHQTGWTGLVASLIDEWRK